MLIAHKHIFTHSQFGWLSRLTVTKDAKQLRFTLSYNETQMRCMVSVCVCVSFFLFNSSFWLWLTKNFHIITFKTRHFHTQIERNPMFKWNFDFNFNTHTHKWRTSIPSSITKKKQLYSSTASPTAVKPKNKKKILFPDCVSERFSPLRLISLYAILLKFLYHLSNSFLFSLLYSVAIYF